MGIVVAGSIANDLKVGDSVTWIAVGNLLTVVALDPLYGRLSDAFGRRSVLLVVLSIFLVGELGSGLVSNLPLMVLFRAMSGVGGGGLLTLPYIIISDITTLERRGFYFGLLTITLILSNVVGIVGSGALAEYVSWKWVFLSNVPLTLITVVLAVFCLPLPVPKGSFWDKFKVVDWAGVGLLVSAICLTVLGTNWGGKVYPWDSPMVLGPLISAVVLLGILIYIEGWYVAHPLLPFHMFTHNVICACLSNFLMGAVWFSYSYYIPLYFEIVHSFNVIDSSYYLLLLMGSACLFSYGSVTFASRFKTYRPLMWAGGCFMLLGTGLMIIITHHTPYYLHIIFILMTSLGIGLNQQLVIITAQAGAPSHEVANATSFISFCLNMGGVVGLALVGAIFNNVLYKNLSKIPGDINVEHVMSTLSHVNTFPKDLVQPITEAYNAAFHFVYIGLLPFSVIALIALVCLKNLKI
ncbi:MFS general substrate transporter [Conidiobolus coronatus NRRL 28638]|uniref:MFS general substrate transporter n=1 Tax=Conidiobolus coronatus (strain ATCC 28846 / CBS 209.66 / NRRL 28638) TaxID=796925 RepID=A0A137P923_CONC2|nr:MFS general substrate transporter [Conidiobolus coronatus NRRL 28638]|eukprot:KXN71500.1 MFS general substrate transporter [Conidiobolus coronatus NRRL 28638]